MARCLEGFKNTENCCEEVGQGCLGGEATDVKVLNIMHWTTIFSNFDAVLYTVKKVLRFPGRSLLPTEWSFYFPLRCLVYSVCSLIYWNLQFESVLGLLRQRVPQDSWADRILIS